MTIQTKSGNSETNIEFDKFNLTVYISPRSQISGNCNFSEMDSSFIRKKGFISIITNRYTENGIKSIKTSENPSSKVFMENFIKLNGVNIPDLLLSSIKLASEITLHNESFLSIIINNNMELFWISAGSNRLYLYRDKELSVLTSEHDSFRNEILSGNVNFSKNKKNLTSFLRNLNEIDFNKKPFFLESGDWLILCNDNVYSYLTNEEIKKIFESREIDFSKKIEDFILAKTGYINDDIGIVLFSVKNNDKSGSKDDLLFSQNSTDSAISSNLSSTQRIKSKRRKKINYKPVFRISSVLIILLFIFFGIYKFLYQNKTDEYDPSIEKPSIISSNENNKNLPPPENGTKISDNILKTELKSNINFISFSPDDKMIITANEDKTISVYEIDKTLFLKNNFKAHESDVTYLSFLNKDILVSHGKDNVVKYFHLKNNKIIKKVENIDLINISPDKKYLARTDISKNILVFNISALSLNSNFSGIKKILSIPSPEKVRLFSFSENGNFFAFLDNKEKVNVWDINKKGKLNEIVCPQKGITSIAIFESSEKSSEKTENKNISDNNEPSDSKYSVVTAFSDGTIIFTDFDNNQTIYNYHNKGINTLIPGENYLLSGGFDGGIKLNNIETGQVMDIWKGKKGINTAAISNNKKSIAFADNDKTLYLLKADFFKLLPK